MAAGFCSIDPRAIKDNPFRSIGEDWMLITAGTLKKHNTMTASWGGFGVLWHKNICFCVVRPVRYTYSFMEDSDYFSLSFFPKKYKSALALCGAKSGRDTDKARATGLRAFSPLRKSVSFKQARLIIVCRKIYFQDIDPARFLDPSIEKLYPNEDYHRMYAGEILRCLKSKR